MFYIILSILYKCEDLGKHHDIPNILLLKYILFSVIKIFLVTVILDICLLSILFFYKVILIFLIYGLKSPVRKTTIYQV